MLTKKRKVFDTDPPIKSYNIDPDLWCVCTCETCGKHFWAQVWDGKGTRFGDKGDPVDRRRVVGFYMLGKPKLRHVFECGDCIHAATQALLPFDKKHESSF